MICVTPVLFNRKKIVNTQIMNINTFNNGSLKYLLCDKGAFKNDVIKVYFILWRQHWSLEKEGKNSQIMNQRDVIYERSLDSNNKGVEGWIR